MLIKVQKKKLLMVSQTADRKSTDPKSPDLEKVLIQKVLIEETPTFDTYETRRRARLIMGALGVACVLLLGWSIYRVFLYDPVGLDATNTADATTTTEGFVSHPALASRAEQ